VFYPHRHGYGNSPGPDWRSECPGEPFSDGYNRAIVARLERESLDVVAALAFLRTLPAVDAARVAVMGSSFGGVNTLLALEREPALRCGVVFAGAAMNWDRNPLIGERLTAAARRVTRPVFYAQAANDFSIRPTNELAAAAAAAGRPHEAKIYPAFGLTAWEGHLVHGRGIRVWRDDVRRFLERWL
jgi:dienelactone hydrolase